MRIALLEDDPDQSQLLAAALEEAGHSCRVCASGRDLMRALARDSFDLMILDWVLPDISGLEILDWLRQRDPVPVMFITRRDREEDVVQALAAGADDYMTKPVRLQEMLARVAALLRRSGEGFEREALVRLGPYEIDQERREIRLDQEATGLTAREYDLALFLFRNPGRVLSRPHLLEQVWGRSPDVNTRTVDAHASRLRRKLRFGSDTGWELVSVYQHGYRLVPPGEDH